MLAARVESASWRPTVSRFLLFVTLSALCFAGLVDFIRDVDASRF